MVGSRGRGARHAATVTTAGLTLSLLMGMSTPAGAVETAPAPSPECHAVAVLVTSAQAAQQTATAKVHAASAALNAAYPSRNKARVAHAAAVKTAAAKQLAAAKVLVQQRTARMAYACAAPTSALRAVAAGKILRLAATGADAPVAAVRADQVPALLDRLVPGSATRLDAGQLAAVVRGLAAPVSAADANALLGGSLSAAQIQSLLTASAPDGALSAALAKALHDLAAASGLPVPTSIDPTTVWDAIAGLVGDFSPEQAGALVAALRAALTGSDAPVTAAQVATLLDSLSPGLAARFTSAELAVISEVLNGTPPSATEVSALLGGVVDPATLTALLNGTLSPSAAAGAISKILGTLGESVGQPVDLQQVVDEVLATLGSWGLPVGGGLLGSLGGLLPTFPLHA